VTAADAIVAVLEADPGEGSDREGLSDWLASAHAALCRAAGQPTRPEGILRAKWETCTLAVLQSVREGVTAGLRSQLAQYANQASRELAEFGPSVWRPETHRWFGRAQAILDQVPHAERAVA
jgi:hypothetical protein